MTDETQKAYAPTKFRRKIPKVTRTFDQYQKEGETMEETETRKAMVGELIAEVMEKGKKFPIGTVHNGYKKVAEGRWDPVKEGGSKTGKPAPVSDEHKHAMTEVTSEHKARKTEMTRVSKMAEDVMRGKPASMEGLSDGLKEKMSELKGAVETLHELKPEDKDFDAVKAAVKESYADVVKETGSHMESFKPDKDKKVKDKAKGKDSKEKSPAEEGEAAARKDNREDGYKEGSPLHDLVDSIHAQASEDSEGNSWIEGDYDLKVSSNDKGGTSIKVTFDGEIAQDKAEELESAIYAQASEDQDGKSWTTGDFNVSWDIVGDKTVITVDFDKPVKGMTAAKKDKKSKSSGGDPAAEGEVAAKEDNKKARTSAKTPADEGAEAAKRDAKIPKPETRITGKGTREYTYSGVKKGDNQSNAIRDILEKEHDIKNVKPEYKNQKNFGRVDFKDEDGVKVATYHPEDQKLIVFQDKNLSRNIPKNIRKSQESDMTDINKEMESMASRMEKAADPKEILISTIVKLGPEGIKKAMPSLNDEQKVLLKSALEDMRKAVEMDANYAGTRKFVRQNQSGMEEENRSDDADEKLVKPEAAVQNHQGDRTPEGIDDHVIKADELKKKQAKEKEEEAKKSFDGVLAEAEELAKSLFPEYSKESEIKVSPEMSAESKKNGAFGDLRYAISQMKDLRDMSWTVSQELPEAKDTFEDKWNALKKEAMAAVKKYSSVKKSMDDSINEAFEKAMKQCGDCKPSAPCKECEETKEVKKSQEDAVQKSKEELIALKNEITKAYETAGLPYTDDLVKAEMKKRIFGAPKKKGDGDNDADDKPGAKKESDKDKKPFPGAAAPFKKSVQYDHPNKRLEACTGGRNFHFSLNGYYDDALQKASAAGQKPAEELSKSQAKSKPDGINDLIEKSLDRDSDTCKTEQLFKSQTKGKNAQGTFSDQDLADAMNMSPADVEKAIGK